MSTFSRVIEQAEHDRAVRGVLAPASSTPPEWPDAVGGGAPPPQADPRPNEDGAAGGAAGRPDGLEAHLVSVLAPNSAEAEQYRTLRHIVEQRCRTAKLSVVAVSSPTVGDGKTLTTINLAGALAQAPDARVLVIDADLRRSAVADQLGLEVLGGGLVGAILDPRLALKDVVELCPAFNLSVVPAGQCSSSPYELLKSPRLGELFDEARRCYDYILVDTPPLIPLPDCRVIGRSVDGFLVVVAAHRTPRRLVQESLHVIEAANILGLVFNGDDAPLADHYHGDSSADGKRSRWVGGAANGARAAATQTRRFFGAGPRMR